MITKSSLGSGYRGTPFMLIIVCFSAFWVIRSSLRVYRVVRRGVVTRKDLYDEIRFGILGAVFLFLAILSIWVHYHEVIVKK